ncbi:MAG: Crp/Fnr family transcriptional regulator, partial [Bacteroidota bacterium]
MQSKDLSLLQELVFASEAFSPVIWEEFVAAWEPFEIGRKAFLTRPGEVERYLYVVLEGVQRGYCLQGE